MPRRVKQSAPAPIRDQLRERIADGEIRALADESDVPYFTLQKWLKEQPGRTFRVDHLEAVALALGCELRLVKPRR